MLNVLTQLTLTLAYETKLADYGFVLTWRLGGLLLALALRFSTSRQPD